MNEAEFLSTVYFLTRIRMNGFFTAFQLGRSLHNLACDYLKDHESLPRGFEGFDY